MSTRIPVALLTLVAVILMSIPTAAGGPIEAGKARLRTPFEFMGKTFDQGTYKVGLEQSGDGMNIVLASKDDVKLFSELAIEMDTKGKSRGKPRASFASAPDNFVRLEVRMGTKRFLAFFPKAS